MTKLAAQQAVDAAIAAHRDRPGALLPILHAVQEAVGHVPAEAVPAIAAALNLSRAEVHGVVGYYHHFRTEPGGRHVLRLCQAEACQAVGAAALADHARAALGCGFHEATADGAIGLEPVYCLGHCAAGPSAMLDDEVHARLTPAELDALIQAARGRP